MSVRMRVAVGPLVIALVAVGVVTTRAGASPRATASASTDAPPHNPFLADSTVPIGHVDAAQTTGTSVAGPTGPTRTLSADQLTYQHLGPGHFGIAISPKYDDGKRVIWSNGGDRISKLDAGTLKPLAELPLPGKTLQTAAQADADIATLDAQHGAELATTALSMSAKYLQGLAGVYYALDSDNTLYVGGADSVIAYGDDGQRGSPITVKREWSRPANVTGSFVGVNMTFDGRLALVTDEGWIVVVTRDFQHYDAIQIPGAEGAAAHNAAVRAAGSRPGAADFVRNSLAVDTDGGIYVASFDHLDKVMWTGKRLSNDAADGAWSVPYLDGTGNGTGATPALMGFGKGHDHLVVITDGEPLMNVVAFWRDGIPKDWKQLPGTPDRRIVGQVPANMGDPSLRTIQTEQSVVVGGYGAFVVNNDPASIPSGFPAVGARVLAGYAGADPAFTPHGVQKVAWDPERRRLATAWTNRSVTSANAVPVVSTGSNVVYTVGVRGGKWALEGIDWTTGKSKFHWTTGSSRYDTLFSGMNIDPQGRLLHTTMFGIVRYDVGERSAAGRDRGAATGAAERGDPRARRTVPSKA
jgi:hypothetical protein